MARKSRKNKEEIEIREIIPEIQKTQKVKVGGYARLSSDQNESDSIETQMLMIKQFVNGHPEMEIEEFYSDEGFSGTNFERPDFHRMMADARFGKIDCIIIKDFSRFGRNYIEAGYYMETVLPRLGIRLISINDRFDSAREEDRNGISVPIKNLINSMYASDVSKKISKSVELHHKIGDAKYRTSTYGFFLNREVNSLEVDPVSSKYVKLIFFWYASGISLHDIANRLNQAGILIPSAYKEQYSERKSASLSGEWTSTTLSMILKNHAYIGCKVNGKQKTSLVEKIDHIVQPKENWYIHENSHPAFIDKALFERVYDSLESYRKKYNENCRQAKLLHSQYQNTFKRKIVCAHCGKTMTYVRKNKGMSQYGYQEAYYTCSQKKDDECRQVVYEDYMKTVVLDQIKEMFKYVCAQKDVISSLRDGRNEKSALLSYEKMLVNQKKKEADCDNLLLNLYKDLSDEVISPDEYKELSAKYTNDKQSIQEKIKRLSQTVYKMKKWIDAFEDLGKSLGDLLSEDTNCQVIIDDLVEKVIVSNDGKIEIVLKCADVIERFNSLLRGGLYEENSNILTPVFG